MTWNSSWSYTSFSTLYTMVPLRGYLYFYHIAILPYCNFLRWLYIVASQTLISNCTRTFFLRALSEIMQLASTSFRMKFWIAAYLSKKAYLQVSDCIIRTSAISCLRYILKFYPLTSYWTFLQCLIKTNAYFFATIVFV